VQLSIAFDGKEDVVDVDAGTGLRYPHLQRIDGTQDTLSALFARRGDGVQ
jgi:hypothetical protein